jgi:hypothetical protein
MIKQSIKTKMGVFMLVWFGQMISIIGSGLCVRCLGLPKNWLGNPVCDRILIWFAPIVIGYPIYWCSRRSLEPSLLHDN